MKKVDKFMYENSTTIIFWFSLILVLFLGIFGSYMHENFAGEIVVLWIVRVVFVVLIPYTIIHFLFDIRYGQYNDVPDSCESALTSMLMVLGASVILTSAISGFKFAFLGG